MFVLMISNINSLSQKSFTPPLMANFGPFRHSVDEVTLQLQFNLIITRVLVDC